jgi:fructose-1,6-bisphosphatase
MLSISDYTRAWAPVWHLQPLILKAGMVEDCLQTGAPGGRGYIVYGKHMFVYTTGHGVHGFSWTRRLASSWLTHEDIAFTEQVYYSPIPHSGKWSKVCRVHQGADAQR